MKPSLFLDSYLIKAVIKKRYNISNKGIKIKHPFIPSLKKIYKIFLIFKENTSNQQPFHLPKGHEVLQALHHQMLLHALHPPNG